MRYFFLFLIIFPEISFSQTKISIRADVTNSVQRRTTNIKPNGVSPHWYVGASNWTWNNVPGVERIYFYMNIPTLPKCSEIIDARLSLWAGVELDPPIGIPGKPTYGSDNATKIFRVSEPWDTNTITWFNSPNIDPNDYIELSQSISTAQDYLNLDATKMVQNMATSGNYGIVFIMDNEKFPYNSMLFYHEKAVNYTKRPLLEITYLENSNGNKATITTNKTEYCIGEKINFTFNSASQISSYSWFLNNRYISNNQSDQITATTLGDNKLTLYYYNGCISDSASFIIKIVDKKQVTILDSLCPGHTLKYYDLTIDSPGIYSTLVRSTNSCDTTITIIVSLKKDCEKCVVEINSIDSICENEVYDFKGTKLLSPGTYSKTVKSNNLCDTLFNLILLLKKDCEKCVIEINSIDSICENEVYDFKGTKLLSPGTYSKTVKSNNLCDTLFNLILLLKKDCEKCVIEINSIDSICENQVYDFKGTTILSPGTYSKIVKSVNACDTLFNLVLLLKKDCEKCVVIVNTIDSICEGETYFFQGNTLLSPGVYSKSIKNSIGCDTTYTLEIKLKSICSNCNVVFPNTFSPNNDNVNDFFTPYIDCKSIPYDIKAYTVKIYNRWGQMVFQYNESSTGWDGRYKNSDPVIDTYIYYAEVLYQNNQSKVFKGDITLLK